MRVDDVGWAAVLDGAAAWVDARAMGGPPRRIVTANPEMLVAARRDPRVRAALETADLVTADGVGVRWAGALLGQPIATLVPGSELAGRLAAHLAARDAPRGRRWFLLGAAEGVAPAAGRALAAAAPGLEIVGTHAGSPRAADLPAIRARLARAAPVDVLLVAYGSPAQELWLAEQLAGLDVGVAIGVGGTLDFLAGRVPWPPPWARRLGLIWAWRLARQPWRWRRQRALAAFVAATLAAAARRALTGSVDGAEGIEPAGDADAVDRPR